MACIKNPDLGRFFDGGSIDGQDPMNRRLAPSIRLERLVERKGSHFQRLVDRTPDWLKTEPTKEVFALERRIGYQARGYAEPHLVPASGQFRSDLTSVPDVFTWLVPRTGRHLPAALIHDGLVHDPNSKVSYVGPPVTRVEADRIFRDALFDLGVNLLRRWLMWSAVTLMTIWKGAMTPTRAALHGSSAHWLVTLQNWYLRGVVLGTLTTISVLGVLATLDLLDQWNGLPWMGSRGHLVEAGYGFASAVATALLLSALWYPLTRAGAITGTALAVLFHVTVALLLLTALFQALEYFARLLRARSKERSDLSSADALPITASATGSD